MTFDTVLTYLSAKLSDTFKYYPQDICTVYLICRLHEWFISWGLNAGEYTSPRWILSKTCFIAPKYEPLVPVP